MLSQVVLVSATLPHEILEMTKKFMTDPIRILVKRYVCIRVRLALSSVVVSLHLGLLVINGAEARAATVSLNDSRHFPYYVSYPPPPKANKRKVHPTPRRNLESF